ncbi:MAG: hypothetical protein WCP97_09305, partial [bacterium]
MASDLSWTDSLLKFIIITILMSPITQLGILYFLLTSWKGFGGINSQVGGIAKKRGARYLGSDVVGNMAKEGVKAQAQAFNEARQRGEGLGSGLKALAEMVKTPNEKTAAKLQKLEEAKGKAKEASEKIEEIDKKAPPVKDINQQYERLQKKLADNPASLTDKEKDFIAAYKDFKDTEKQYNEAGGAAKTIRDFSKQLGTNIAELDTLENEKSDYAAEQAALHASTQYQSAPTDLKNELDKAVTDKYTKDGKFIDDRIAAKNAEIDNLKNRTKAGGDVRAAADVLDTAYGMKRMSDSLNTTDSKVMNSAIDSALSPVENEIDQFNAHDKQQEYDDVYKAGQDAGYDPVEEEMENRKKEKELLKLEKEKNEKDAKNQNTLGLKYGAATQKLNEGLGGFIGGVGSVVGAVVDQPIQDAMVPRSLASAAKMAQEIHTAFQQSSFGGIAKLQEAIQNGMHVQALGVGGRMLAANALDIVTEAVQSGNYDAASRYFELVNSVSKVGKYGGRNGGYRMKLLSDIENFTAEKKPDGANGSANTLNYIDTMEEAYREWAKQTGTNINGTKNWDANLGVAQKSDKYQKILKDKLNGKRMLKDANFAKLESYFQDDIAKGVTGNMDATYASLTADQRDKVDGYIKNDLSLLDWASGLDRLGRERMETLDSKAFELDSGKRSTFTFGRTTASGNLKRIAEKTGLAMAAKEDEPLVKGEGYTYRMAKYGRAALVRQQNFTQDAMKVLIGEYDRVRLGTSESGAYGIEYDVNGNGNWQRMELDEIKKKVDGTTDAEGVAALGGEDGKSKIQERLDVVGKVLGGAVAQQRHIKAIVNDKSFVRAAEAEKETELTPNHRLQTALESTGFDLVPTEKGGKTRLRLVPKAGVTPKDQQKAEALGYYLQAITESNPDAYDVQDQFGGTPLTVGSVPVNIPKPLQRDYDGKGTVRTGQYTPGSLQPEVLEAGVKQFDPENQTFAAEYTTGHEVGHAFIDAVRSTDSGVDGNIAQIGQRAREINPRWANMNDEEIIVDSMARASKGYAGEEDNAVLGAVRSTLGTEHVAAFDQMTGARAVEVVNPTTSQTENQISFGNLDDQGNSAFNSGAFAQAAQSIGIDTSHIA